MRYSGSIMLMSIFNDEHREPRRDRGLRLSRFDAFVALIAALILLLLAQPCLTMQSLAFSIFIFVAVLCGQAISFRFHRQIIRSAQHSSLQVVQRDEQGYEIKPRDWFNGLSLDPGASLTDPRAVPPECKKFAEDVKSGRLQPSLAESIAFIDQYYDYFAVIY